ncbi:hypothetical protein [Isobaculum melis]|uniref:MazG nucleotide pyrophosphohydrolase domain-containing protein n=1 Tax=Isobaculum melis TaxID=142588 RepID=A0A1H9Q4G4_9LACT|nr:hypothetical protein [Isobaculum melis]SER55357.1 hypothetical protein SAMN04488559_101341 [Isobaculum melis]
MEKNGARIIELSRKVIDDSYTVVDYLEEGEDREAQEYLVLAKEGMDQLWYEIGVAEGTADSGRDVSELMYLMQYVYMASTGLTMAKGKIKC